MRRHVGGDEETCRMHPATLLDFETRHPRHSGRKEEAIRTELGLTPARYYVLLRRAARSMDGWKHDPMLARRWA